MEGLPVEKANALTEKICGICSNSHIWNSCRTAEMGLGIEIPQRALYIRVIMGELERLHSHFLYLAHGCEVLSHETFSMRVFYLREIVMELLAMIGGNRVQYGCSVLGGVRPRCDLDEAKLLRLKNDMDAVEEGLTGFVERFLAATSMDKFIAMLIVVLLGSTLILYFFDPSIVTVFDAVWFVFQTVTTVGFGDVIPSSPLGKFVGLVLLINGVLMFSIFTASFAYMFNDRIFKKENDEFNQRVDSLKDNMNETVTSIDAIKEKVNSNDVELAEIKENINELSVKIDELIKIIEKKE
jgi:ABC-type multidrug transport system fused ATPase/permease subunit